MRQFLWTILLSGLLAHSHIAVAGGVGKTIYKWQDQNGVTRYTDMPPPKNAKNVTKMTKNKSKKVTSRPMAAEEVPDQAAEEAAARKKEMARVEAEKAKQKIAEAKRKQANCAAARSNYQAYAQGGRVYKTNAAGEREYMDDAGLARAKSEAQRQMQENCY